MNVIDAHLWIGNLGWTLLHSLWQGFVIGLIFLVARRFLPSASSYHYAAGIAALVLILITAAGTFVYLSRQTIPVAELTREIIITNQTTTSSPYWRIDQFVQWPALTGWVNAHLPLLVSGWLIGILVFGLRLLITWWNTIHLRNGAKRIVGFWEMKLHQLAGHLGIRQTILLAESNRVDAPLLIGYLKPLILLPVGMISGLSADQVETILLHELAHVQRHDFIINFIQSVMEVIFFFNPFVWIISAYIRSDREQCCDDQVVDLKSPLIYAQALHRLAEAQTMGTAFSLGVAGTENKLLQRIKRIMKTSQRKDERRGKVFPAVLAIMALITASWLSIQAYEPEGKDIPASVSANHYTVPGDTVKKDLQQGEPDTEIMESSDDDGDPLSWVMPPDVNIEIPLIPEILEALPEFAEVPMFPEPVELENLNFQLHALDTLPQGGVWFGPDRNEWEKEFTAKFREQFADFYEKNQSELEKLMKELDANLKNRHEYLDQARAKSMDDRLQSELARVQSELHRLAPHQEKIRYEQSEQMRKLNEDMARQRENIAFKRQEQKGHQELMARKIDEQKGHMKSLEKKMKAFEKELIAELVKDGYLAKDEKVESINWEDNGSIKVNGKKIKESDTQKYRTLHDRYFRQGSRIGIAE